MSDSKPTPKSEAWPPAPEIDLDAFETVTECARRGQALDDAIRAHRANHASEWRAPNSHRFTIVKWWIGYRIVLEWGFWPSPPFSWRLTRKQAEMVGARWIKEGEAFT